MADNSNEFISSPDNNDIRPYTSGMTRHEETPATIILYTKNGSSGGQSKGASKDYLSDFDGDPIGLLTGAKTNLESIEKFASGNIRKLDKMSNDDNRPYYSIFNNFSLTNVQETNEQIVKVQVNFGSSWNAFFFGEKPKIYQFSGVFLDSKEYPYYQEFLTAYENYLSGRKAIENKMQMIISYDGRLVDGYMLNIATTHTAANQLVKAFQFTVLVKESIFIRNNFDRDIDGSPNGSGLNSMGNTHRLARFPSLVADALEREEDTKI